MTSVSGVQRFNGAPNGSSESVDEYELPADYKPYVPVAKRRAQLLKTLSNRGAKRFKTSSDDERSTPEPSRASSSQLDADEQARELARRERTLMQAAIDLKEKKAAEDEGKSKAELAAAEEAKLLEEMEKGQKKLAGVRDIAEGRVWTDSLKTTWRAPAYVRERTAEEQLWVKEKNHIIVEGSDVPPAIENFTVSWMAREPRLMIAGHEDTEAYPQVSPGQGHQEAHPHPDAGDTNSVSHSMIKVAESTALRADSQDEI